MTIREAWLGYWGAMRRYHRYEVAGLEHLNSARGPCLLVGYHGRPLAIDLCMLSVTLHERLGYLVHGVVHAAFARPPLRRFADALGFVTADGPELHGALARGEHVVVTPGGTREGCRSFRHRYRVDWGERLGYLRLAIRHGLPVVPVAASGVDDAYVGLVDGYALGKRAALPHGLPLWAGFGPLGPWPWSPPFPVHIRQALGAPLHVDAALDDRPALLAWHRRVAAAVQDLLARVRT